MNAPFVPRYVTKAAGRFEGCPPGHRFSLYFPIWKEYGWQLAKYGKPKQSTRGSDEIAWSFAIQRALCILCTY